MKQRSLKIDLTGFGKKYRNAVKAVPARRILSGKLQLDNSALAFL